MIVCPEKKRPCSPGSHGSHIYNISHLGLFTHQEIGRAFGVGYTSIPGTLKQAKSFMDSDKKIRRNVVGVLNDI